LGETLFWIQHPNKKGYGPRSWIGCLLLLIYWEWGPYGKISDGDFSLGQYGKVEVWDFPVKIECSRLISCLLCGFFSLFCKPVISPWALQENNTLQLANQSARYIGHKNNLCNKHVYQSSIISWADLFLKFIGWLRFSFLMAWQWKPAIEKSCMLGTTGRSGAVLFYGESWWCAYPILYGYIIEFKLMRPTLKV